MARLLTWSVRSSSLAALVAVTLALAACSSSPAADPAKAGPTGTEILWDRYGIPHIFAPDHPSLFYAYGYAQMEAHAELLLRLYAQARGRGAEFYGDAVPRQPIAGCAPTASRRRRSSGRRGQSAGVRRRSSRAFVRGPERLGRRAQGRAQPRGAGACCRSPSRTSTRTACASSTTTGSSTREARRHGSRAPSRDARLERVGDRARRRSASGQGDADEQLAPAVGRHAHLLRGAAHGARRHVVRRGVGRLPGAAPVLHRVRRLDADDEQPGGVGSLSPGAEGRRLRARRPGAAVRDAHRDRSRCGRPTARCATCRSQSGARVHGPVVAERRGVADCDARGGHRSAADVRAVLAHGPGEELRRVARRRCACSNCRSSTPPTPTATATSPTSTTRRCRCTRPATIASGRASCRAISRSSSPTTIVPYDADPEGDRSADRMGAELQRHAVDVDVSDDARLDEVRRRLRRAAGHHAARAARHPHPRTAPAKMTFEDLKKRKLSTRVRDRRPVRRRYRRHRAKAWAPNAPSGPPTCWRQWDREAEATSDGTLLFYVHARRRRRTSRPSAASRCRPTIGGRSTTPRGFKDPAKAMALLDTVAGEVEKEYGIAARQVGRRDALPPRQRRPARQRRAVAARRHPHDRHRARS